MDKIKTLVMQAAETAHIDPHKPVSSAFRLALLKSGLSSTEIANKTGIDQSCLHRFMTGKRNISLQSLDRLAVFCKIQVITPESPAEEP